MTAPQIATTLRADILAGRITPGEALQQEDLAARFGVSRIPVRDALQQLAAARLVEVVPGRGARVVRLTRDELAEVFELRRLLECNALRRATTRAKAADHEAVEHARQQSDLEAGRPGWQAGDWAFHAAIYAAANHPRQIAMIAELRDTCQMHIAAYDRLSDDTPRWLADHQAISAAFCAGDADAAASRLAKHIMAARDRLLTLLAD